MFQAMLGCDIKKVYCIDLTRFEADYAIALVEIAMQDVDEICFPKTFLTTLSSI